MPGGQSANDYYLNISLSSSRKCLKGVMDGVTPVARISRWVVIRGQMPLFTDAHRRLWEQCLESGEEGSLFQVTQTVSAELSF